MPASTHASTAIIPALPGSAEKPLSIGAAQDLGLEIKYGAAGRVCLAVGQPFQLRIKFLARATAAAAKIWTDLNSLAGHASFAWQELQAESSGIFGIQMPTERAGRFHFFIQYTLDGQQWFWLRGSAWHIFVSPLQLKGLRLYTLIPNASGKMSGWPKRLKELKDLGFTMLHILPLTQQGLSQSPYAATKLFTIDPEFIGHEPNEESPLALAKLVETAKTLELGLCFDLVLNHVAVDSELAGRCPHWITPDAAEPDGMKRAGFASSEGFHKWRDLVLIDYQHPDPQTRHEIWEYMTAYVHYWAEPAAATNGMIRLDNLHSTPANFVRTILNDLRNRWPNLGILGEFFASHEATQVFVENHPIDLLLATTWEHHFAQELRRYLSYIHNSVPSLPWFTPINSHDSGVPAQEFADVRATGPRYILCCLLGQGASGMTQGVERGIREKINFIGRLALRETKSDQDFRPLIKKTHELLRDHQLFQQLGNLIFIDHNHPAIIAAWRQNRESTGPSFLVVVNLDIHQQQSLALDLASIGLDGLRLTEVFSGESLACQAGQLTLRLEPCDYRVIACLKI